MKNSNLIKLFWSIILFIFSTQVNAQSKQKSDTSYFKIQADYLSNYTYNGRVDSLKSPYQITTATYHMANGIYFTGVSDYLLTNGQARFDFFEFDLGYEYKLNEKLSGELYASKYFYSNNANLLNGNISSDFGASLNYDLGAFQFNNTLDLFFSNATDFQYNPGIEKSIEFDGKNGTWNITPGFYANIGSVNYYESIVNRKLNAPKGAKGKIVNSNVPVINNVTKVDNNGIKLLDMELTMPVSYETGKWSFYMTPTFAIPKNPIYTTSVITTTLPTGTSSSITSNSTPYSERNLKNTFYMQLGISYRL